jgi:hypothetical protein
VPTSKDLATAGKTGGQSRQPDPGNHGPGVIHAERILVRFAAPDWILLLDPTDNRRFRSSGVAWSFMPVTSEAKPGGFSRWLQSNPVVIITFFGVLLYAMFSIPSIIFYARLGTSASEVGFTYASVLSGATLGTVFVLAGMVAAVFYIGAMILSLLYIALWAAGVIWSWFNKELSKDDWELDADQFERKLKFARIIYFGKSPTWKKMESNLRRSRELHMLEGLTPAEASELEHLNSLLLYARVMNSSFYALRHWLRPRIWYVYALFLIITGTTIALAVTASNQADTVLHGKTYFGDQSGVFAYHAEIVYVRSASTDTAKSIQQLVGKRLFLLGENAQHIILYSSDFRSTIRIPVNAVVVTSSPSGS